MSDPLPFESDRFRAAAARYREGRRPYPPVLIRRVAEATALNEQHRVLDLGCGLGNLAIGFGYSAGKVIGLDPEPEMGGINCTAQHEPSLTCKFCPAEFLLLS
jgi:ubiquinone/menaquinone biosynthesis C-methylase UbiE